MPAEPSSRAWWPATSTATENLLHLQHDLAFGVPFLEVIEGGLPSVGRNAGARLATTPYVLFLDADVELPEPYLGLLRANPVAWAFYQKQPPSYLKAVNWWIAGARKDETRRRRLDSLIAYSVRAERVPQFTWKKASG